MSASRWMVQVLALKVALTDCCRRLAQPCLINDAGRHEDQPRKNVWL